MVECISYRQKQNETWRYFSYSLVHADVAHLKTNMLCLVGLGTLLHMTNRTVVLLLLYVLGVKKQLSTGCVNCHLFPAGSIRVNGLLCLWRKFSAAGRVQRGSLLSCWYLPPSAKAQDRNVLRILKTIPKVRFSPQCWWTGGKTGSCYSNTGQAGNFLLILCPRLKSACLHINVDIITLKGNHWPSGDDSFRSSGSFL